ncbi:MAG: GGDEF domain-containing protein [Firmicutes bacterium]|nr:GGDEF domain-containing protein [Bacillota bacterium]
MKIRLKDSLAFKFVTVFAVFMVIVLSVVAFATYTIQNAVYKDQLETRVRNVSTQLMHFLESDGQDFLNLAHYYKKHAEDMHIEYEGNYSLNIPNWESRKTLFDTKYQELYGFDVLNEDVDFEDMPLELQRIFAEYEWLYCQKIFNDATDTYGLAYTYLAVPEEDADLPYSLSYLMDPASEDLVVDGKVYRYLGMPFGDGTRESHEKLWDTYEKKAVDGFEVYDNEFGYTYACYSLLEINGEVVGVIGAEVDADKVNQSIVVITLQTVALIGGIIAIFSGILVWFVYSHYIKRLDIMQIYVSEYASSKDIAIADKIHSIGKSKDEISALAFQFSDMIIQIDEYIDQVTSTQNALKKEKDNSRILKQKYQTDALTGLKNRASYENELKNLDWQIKSKTAKFGIAMIDLNFLKRVNDTYGHDKGNIMIKKCSKMICDTFKHSPVFRIGGDEFVIILRGHDFKYINELREAIDEQMRSWKDDESLENWEKVSAAFGYASFDPTIDNNADSVFKRADKAMYLNKKEMKAVRTE